MNHMKEHGLSVAIKSCICRKCGMAFVQQQALDQHLLQHHRMNELCSVIHFDFNLLKLLFLRR